MYVLLSSHFICRVFISFFFFFKQKTAYEMRISDWSSDVCSSDLADRDIVAAVETLLEFVLLDRRLAARDEDFAAGDEAAIEHVVDVVDLHLVAVRVRRRLVGAAAFLDIDDIDDDDVVTLLVLDLDVDIRAGAVVDDHYLGIVVLAMDRKRVVEGKSGE